jgi:predicted NBD/HSP70 family sugar kinase
LKEHPDSAGEVYSLAMSGDENTRSIFEETGSAIGICIAALVNTMNPPLVVIAGGISDAWGLFSPKMFEELEHRSITYGLTR